MDWGQVTLYVYEVRISVPTGTARLRNFAKLRSNALQQYPQKAHHTSSFLFQVAMASTLIAMASNLLNHHLGMWLEPY